MLCQPLRYLATASCAAMLMLIAVPVARATDVLVAVAANFADAARDLAGRFESATGNRLVVTTGSTGKLYAQILSGAPFQILLSADARTPAKLEEEQAAVAGTRFTYAIGQLALWRSDAGKISAETLAAGAFAHLAIANPDLAPYGVAARETLRSLGLWDKLAPKIVMGENVGQTHSMVATGNAELGFVAFSAVQNPQKPSEGSFWLVPQDLFTPIRQDAVLLNPGSDNPAARAFLDFLQSPEARAVIQDHGYGTD